MDWGAVFFRLHHYCHLNKWEIYEYTLPQITELMKHTNKHVQFQVEVARAPFKALFGGGGSDEEEYREINEDDVMELMNVFNG